MHPVGLSRAAKKVLCESPNEVKLFLKKKRPLFRLNGQFIDFIELLKQCYFNKHHHQSHRDRIEMTFTPKSSPYEAPKSLKLPSSAFQFIHYLYINGQPFAEIGFYVRNYQVITLHFHYRAFSTAENS